MDNREEERFYFADMVLAWCTMLALMILLLVIGRHTAPDQLDGFSCAERAGGECVMYLRDDIHPAEVCDGR